MIETPWCLKGHEVFDQRCEDCVKRILEKYNELARQTLQKIEIAKTIVRHPAEDEIDRICAEHVSQEDTAAPIEAGKWGLYLNDRLLGESKTRFDADHARRIVQLFVEEG